MEEDNPAPNQTTESDSSDATGFQPLLYNFRVGPVTDDAKKFSIQLPFSVLFDNLITVLWSMYGKDQKIQCGINQMRWALEFLKCFKVEYTYPDSIAKIVKDTEVKIIALYAKLGSKLQEIQTQREMDEEDEIKMDDLQKSNESSVFDQAMNCVSYSEKDLIEKLNGLNVPVDSITGEPKFLKDLNSLGGCKRKKPVEPVCKVEKKNSKTFMLGALQKILDNTSEEGTITEVEELIKGLKDQNSNMESKKSSKI